MGNTPIKFSAENLKSQIYKNLSALIIDTTEMSLLVGIPGTAQTKVSKKDASSGDIPLNIATYAAKNEFGSFSERTPARPFMRTTFTGERLKKIEKAANIIFTQIAQTNRDAKSALQKLGMFIVGQIQQNITHGQWKPNSPYTIAKKGSSKPLIDTGAMRQSISSWVTFRRGR